MKEIFKYIGIFSLFVFSLIYTDKVIDLMQSKTTIMKQIRSNPSKKVEAVSAIIDGDYIIPGLNGLAINEKESYSKMVLAGSFDDKLFVYDQIIPSVSLTDNLEKIIKKANRLKRAIAIVTDEKHILNYLLKENIRVDYLIDTSNVIKSDKAELINNDFTNYYKIESFLNHNNYNHNICVINKNIEEICRKNKKILVEPTYIINNSNMSSYIMDIDTGDILKLENLSTTNLSVLINEIKYRDLNILYLSELISENNTLL